MKKSLIALAALAAVSAVSAQSNVTIGGNMTLGFGQTTTGNVGAGPAILKQTGNIAFKGTEDLGGGLKANFEVQTAIGDAAASSVNAVAATATPGGTLAATTLGDRGAYINVTGGFGAVQMGRANSAVRAMGAIWDVSGTPVKTGLSTGNSLGTTIAKSGDVASRPIYGDAYANWAGYTTPSISGFTFNVSIAPVDGDTTLTKDAMSYTAAYTNGPLNIAYNHLDSKATSAGTAILGGGTSTTADVAYTPVVEAYKMSTIVANYDFGVAKVGFVTQSIGMATGVNPGNGYAITVNVPVGQGFIGAGYGNRQATTSSQIQFGDSVKQTFVAYNYMMSKRTKLSAVYNKVDREAATVTNDVKEMHLMISHAF
jgi:hypothetical protein